MMRTAMRLNPDAGFIYFVVLGGAHLFLSDIEQPMINLREALARNPVDLEARVFMAATLVAVGDRSAAGWEAVEFRALKSGFAARGTNAPAGRTSHCKAGWTKAWEHSLAQECPQPDRSTR